LFNECIIGTDFLLKSHAKIDFYARFVSFYDDLTALPLLPLHPTDNIVRLAQTLTIPPCSKALTRVAIDRKYRPQLSVMEPLSTLGGRKNALAKALVQPKGHFTICRLLNPTNSPISIPAHTPIATLEPIDERDPGNRRFLTNTKPICTTFVNSMSSGTNLSHAQRLRTLLDMEIPLKQDKLTDTEFEQMT